MRNEQFANKKALLSAHTQEVDEVLSRYGGDWALLSLCAEELGLGGVGSPTPGSRGSRDGTTLSMSTNEERTQLESASVDFFHWRLGTAPFLDHHPYGGSLARISSK